MINKFEVRYLASVVVLALVIVFLPKNASALTLTPVRFEVSGDPGAVIQQEMTLINERDTEETYYSSFSNFEAQGETGSPSFVDPVDGLGTWMETDTVVTLAPGTSKIVPVTIRIPESAEAGGYFAAVFWGTNNPELAEGGSIAIGAKTGVLMLLRVNGEVDEKGGILEYDTIDHKNFFTSLPVSFYYRFQNSGGDRIKPDGDIVIRHMFGFVRAKVPANAVQGNVLPSQTRRFEAVWQSGNGSSDVADIENLGFFKKVVYEWKNFAFGYYTANISLAYGTNDDQTSTAKAGFFVFPWHLILVIVIALFILIQIVHRVRNHYRRNLMESLRSEIKEELKQEMNENSTPKV